MKHVAALTVALFSMLFLMGDSCDSGDFTTSYYCCGQAASCTTAATTCAPSDCNTGFQSFTNGQNECSTLQSDGPNNSCALLQRFIQYLTIGCTGTFTEIPAVAGVPFLQPQNFTATPGPGSATVTLSWIPPANIPAGATLLYTVLRGGASQTETALATTNASPFYDTASSGIATGEVLFYEVVASITYAGNVASPGNAATEVSVTVP